MSDGGFLVKFIDKDGNTEEHRCYAVSFDYDTHKYTLNNEESKSIPAMVKVEIMQEDGQEDIKADMDNMLGK